MKSPPTNTMFAPGPDTDVAISSRVRIARNVAPHSFPHRMSLDEKRQLEDLIIRALPHLGPVRLQNLPPEKRAALAGAHLAPPAFALAGQGLLLLDRTKTVSVLVNEEDHIRIQAFCPGSDLEGAAAKACEVENQVSLSLPFAWNSAHGYLTASPANAGSGVRASVLLHLPVLAGGCGLRKWLDALTRSGCSIRGVFGEGTRAFGAFFQASVIAKRDESPLEAAGRLALAVRMLTQEERNARKVRGLDWALQCARRCASALERAELLGLADSLKLVSWVRLAAAMTSEEACRKVDAISTGLLVDVPGRQTWIGVRRAKVLKNLIELLT